MSFSTNQPHMEFTKRLFKSVVVVGGGGVCVCVCRCHGTHVEVGGQLSGVSSPPTLLVRVSIISPGLWTSHWLVHHHPGDSLASTLS